MLSIRCVDLNRTLERDMERTSFVFDFEELDRSFDELLPAINFSNESVIIVALDKNNS